MKIHLVLLLIQSLLLPLIIFLSQALMCKLQCIHVLETQLLVNENLTF